MYKQIRFFIKNSTRLILTFLISLFAIRDKKIIIMGLRTPVTNLNKVSKDYFMHNTKYLFLKLSKICNDFKFIYLCDNKDMINALYEAGFKNIYPRKSLKGLYYTLRAKYWLYDDFKDCINNHLLSGGAVCVNLWHGTGSLKSCGNILEKYKNNPILAKIYIALFEYRSSFYNIDSEHEANGRKFMFGATDKEIVINGSPRLDILFEDIKYADLFMEKDFKEIKKFKEESKKLFFYTPTFRDTGKDISGWLKSEKLKQFLHNNNAVLVCKLHFADKNSLNFELSDEFYKMDSTSDIYPVLKYADCLISDYSSIYFDFLLLDKPIIYHVPDLEEYQEQCRGFYEPYETLTAGIKTRTDDEIISAMQNVINGIDNYKEDRKRLRDQTFYYQDGKNCERVIEWIKSLG